jgi:hypothetical protein
VGIEETTKEIEFLVFPNPADQLLTIEWNEQKPIYFTISDVSGKLIHTKTVNDKFITIDVSSLTPGVYFINANYMNKTVNKSFIVK